MTERDVALPDGRTLHVDDRGTAVPGRPTVVFVSGMGASRLAWLAVQPAVAERTRAVAYDRAGLGRSAVDDRPRTLARAAGDLSDLLGALDAGPAILVGHSYGGPIVRTVAAEAPALVAGLVLVDASDEGCDRFFADAARRQQRISMAMAGGLARLGVLRAVQRKAASPLPPADREAIAAEDGSVRAVAALRAELAHFETDLAALRDHPLPDPVVPVTVISGTRPARSGAADRACLIAAHRRRAEAAPRGRHVAAERSGHLVIYTEPELVVAETLRMVEAGSTA